MPPPKFKYRGFGLNIGSDLEFPELFPHDFGRADLRVETGPITDAWFAAQDPGRPSQRIDPGSFRLWIPGAGRYLATGGDKICLDTVITGDISAFRMYALTVAFSACLLQRDLTMLHASGIVGTNSVFLFAGASGAGKSTLVSHLMRSGRQIFTDDVCVFDGRRDKQGHWLASASYPILKMHPEGIVRYFPTEMLWPLWPDDPKMGVGFHPVFRPDPMPVGGVAMIVRDAGIDRIVLERVSGVNAFEALAGCIYRPGLIHTSSQRTAVTKVVSGLADSVPVYRVRRPARPDDGSELSKAMDALMRGSG